MKSVQLGWTIIGGLVGAFNKVLDDEATRRDPTAVPASDVRNAPRKNRSADLSGNARAQRWGHDLERLSA
jgi:hypothetical protein